MFPSSNESECASQRENGLLENDVKEIDTKGNVLILEKEVSSI